MSQLLKQETLPNITLNMQHRMVLSRHQRECLLEERQSIIEQSIEKIQLNFFRIGKALAEIKKFKLYKNEFCSSWTEYLRKYVKSNLHQSTISDYIGIVKMQTENSELFREQDIARLGYKKVKLIKSKMNLINKENDLYVRKHLRDRLKDFYLKSINKEFRDLPFPTYEKALVSYLQVPGQVKPIQSEHVTQQENQYFRIKWDKKQNKLTILSQKGQEQHLEKLYQLVLKINEFR